MKPNYYYVLILPILVFSFTMIGCGKTIDQLVKTGQDLIGVAGEVYKDVKENVETAKKLVTEPASPAK